MTIKSTKPYEQCYSIERDMKMLCGCFNRRKTDILELTHS